MKKLVTFMAVLCLAAVITESVQAATISPSASGYLFRHERTGDVYPDGKGWAEGAGLTGYPIGFTNTGRLFAAADYDLSAYGDGSTITSARISSVNTMWAVNYFVDLSLDETNIAANTTDGLSLWNATPISSFQEDIGASAVMSIDVTNAVKAALARGDTVFNARITPIWTGGPGYLTADNPATFYVMEVIPEPATLAILGIGALGLLRKKRA